MKNAYLINFITISDDRGHLISLEQQKNISFDIKRVYYIFDTKPDVRRGFHAHKALEQVLVCVKGSCNVLLDDATTQQTIVLNSPDKSLYVGPMIWREMFNFSQDCVLLVLASDYYDENDYIRDYAEFLKWGLK